MYSGMSVPPLVVAVLVANDPGDWFEESLASLANSDYPNLSSVVVDNGSRVPLAQRVHAVAGDAFLIRNEINLGFGNAVNAAVKNVPTAAYLLVCHDDVAFATDAISVMVEDALRMNASIVAPKLVAWSYPDRVLSLGFGLDRTAAMRTRVDVGDLDQDQFPIVEEVFAASAAAMLVRHDLFLALGGFDPDMYLFGEDVDLCYRAQLAGARAVASSYAKVRHMGVMVSGPDEQYLSSRYQPIRRRVARAERTYFVRANQMRCIKNNSRGIRQRISVLQLGVLALLEATYFAVTGRLKTSKEILRALRDGARRTAGSIERRESGSASAMVEQREISGRLAKGSARLSAFFAHQRNTRAQLRYEVERSRRSSKGAIVEKELLDVEASDPTAIATRYVQRRLARILQVVTVLMVLFAARHVILGTLPTYGSLAPFPRASSLLSDFYSGSLSPSVSLPTSVPAGYLWIGVLGLPFFGATGILTHAFLAGLVALGMLGAYRFGAKYRNPLSSTLAMLGYVVSGSLFGVFSAVSLFGVVTFAFVPWVVGQLFDFVERTTQDRGFDFRAFFRAAFLCSVATSIAPGFLILYLVLGLAVTLAYLVSGQASARGVSRQLRFVLGILGVCLVGNASWFLGYLVPGATAASLLGSLPPQYLSFHQLLEFSTGPTSSTNTLGAFVYIAMVVTPVIAKGIRLLRAELVLVSGVIVFIFMVASNGGAFGVDPLPLVYFAPAMAAIVAYATANAIDSLYRDLPRENFGYRQISGVMVVAGVFVAALGMAVPLIGGNLGLPVVGYEHSLGWVGGSNTKNQTRLLWIGSPDSIPAGSWWLASGVGFAVTTNQTVTFENVYTPLQVGHFKALDLGLSRAAAFKTTHLGDYLAAAHVQYLIYPQSGVNSAVAKVTLALARQTDLSQVLTDPSVTGYQTSGPVLNPVSKPTDSDLIAPLVVAMAETIVWLVFLDIVFFGAFVSSRVFTWIRVSRSTERDQRAIYTAPGSPKKRAGVN